MNKFINMNYGYFVCNDNLFDYWMTNGMLYPTSYKYLDRGYCYKFEIDEGYCYPSFWGLIPLIDYKKSSNRNCK